MTPTPVKPDYNGNCLSRLVKAIRAGGVEDWIPEPVRGARCVVLFVIDGIGWSAFETHRAALPNLASMQATQATTVVPSTTAVALTSITNGVPPAVHGVTGYRMRTSAETVLNVLRWSAPNRRPVPSPIDINSREAFDGQPFPVVTRRSFRKTKFSDLHMRGVEIDGYSSTSSITPIVVKHADAGAEFIYAYYDGVDTTAHERGLIDGLWEKELIFADSLVGELLDNLDSDTAVVVTGDHGHVHLTDRLDLDAVMPFVECCAGDGRFRELHALPGKAGELHAAAVDAYSDVAWVFTRDELCDGGWLGDPVPASVRRRIGDVILAAHAPVMFVDPSNRTEAGVLSGHGSLTSDEMVVGVFGARGRRG